MTTPTQCAWCLKWLSESRPKAGEFVSHGICGECAKNLTGGVNGDTLGVMPSSYQKPLDAPACVLTEPESIHAALDHQQNP